jgi:hypothetical protein
MKNIHVLPTDKPSRLYYSGNNHELILSKQPVSFRIFERSTQHIYITSNEKFKQDEYITDGIEVIKATPKLVNAQGLVDRRDWKKIILTTDQELIKDGVWGIEDGFLEWFVKNPTCEYVELKGYAIILPGESCDCDKMCSECEAKQETLTYTEAAKKEERIFNSTMMSKQETLEEVAERLLLGEDLDLSDYDKRHILKAMVNIAKWQQEQDKNKYSEEEMLDFGNFIFKNTLLVSVKGVEGVLKQFKKK